MSLLILVDNLIDFLQKFQVGLKNGDDKESLQVSLEEILNLDNKVQSALTDLQETDKLCKNLHLSEKRLNSIKGEYLTFLEQVQNRIYQTEENIKEFEYTNNLIKNINFDVCGLMKFAYRIACQKASFGRPPYPTEDLMRRTFLFEEQIKNVQESQPVESEMIKRVESTKGELLLLQVSRQRATDVIINLDIGSDIDGESD